MNKTRHACAFVWFGSSVEFETLLRHTKHMLYMTRERICSGPDSLLSRNNCCHVQLQLTTLDGFIRSCCWETCRCLYGCTVYWIKRILYMPIISAEFLNNYNSHLTSVFPHLSSKPTAPSSGLGCVVRSLCMISAQNPLSQTLACVWFSDTLRN